MKQYTLFDSPEPHGPMDISVVIPAYNEQENLPILIPKVDAVLSALEGEHEIVVIDDRSTDNTRQVLRELAETYPRLKPLYFKTNCGQSSAFEAGFRHARGEVVVTMDADLQNDPEDIPTLLAKMNEADCVCGRRTNRRDSATKKIVSRVANAFRRRALGDPIRDTGCSLKAFRREAVERLKMYKGMHRFLSTLVVLEGYRIAEVPVRHHPRQYGTSKYNLFNRSIGPIMDLLAVMWMKRRTVRWELDEEPRADD